MTQIRSVPILPISREEFEAIRTIHHISNIGVILNRDGKRICTISWTPG